MIVLSDMSRCSPGEALSEVRKHHHWHLISYEAEGLTGVIIGASSTAKAPDVTLPVEASGWHAIYVGFWNFQF
ncbi:MAG: hypothetical protein QF749_14045, partial [Verrucomicrobiota bacterium]|nr:hypothetical protein [Verrucomicrobiota bacterium]